MRKLKIYYKVLKMSKISKLYNFGPTSTNYTSKESIFHAEFNFIQERYDFLQEKLKKKIFFRIFFKIKADQLSSNEIF